MALFPPSTTAVARRLVVARSARGCADGLVSVLLASYLIGLGFSAFRVGAVVTATLVGSAGLTLAVGLIGHRVPVRSLLLGASVTMLITGVGFGSLSSFWPILVVAVIGTLNPSGGDVSVFLPTEQAVLADEVDDGDRPQLYAIYNVGGKLAGAVGALASGVPALLAASTGFDLTFAQRLGFAFYALIAVVVAVVYAGLERPARVPKVDRVRQAPLKRSRRIVLELAALFSLDSAASGFVIQSLLVLWLDLRFGLSAGAIGTVFFAAGLLAALSQLLAGPLARRIGLVPTMVVTHLPANVALVLAAFAPTAPIAIALLLVRSLLSQMDVPARQSFVMAVVPKEERPAASSITNVPRSLAAATTPLLAGLLLARTSFGWPLVIAGTGKIIYDLVLLALYRNVPAVEGATRQSVPT